MNEKVGLSIDGVLDMMKQKILSKCRKKRFQIDYKKRFDYENTSDFYYCGNIDCSRSTFEEALDLFFKCPTCGEVQKLKNNDRSRKFFLKKIDQIKEDVKV